MTTLALFFCPPLRSPTWFFPRPSVLCVPACLLLSAFCCLPPAFPRFASSGATSIVAFLSPVWKTQSCFVFQLYSAYCYHHGFKILGAIASAFGAVVRSLSGCIHSRLLGSRRPTCHRHSFTNRASEAV